MREAPLCTIQRLKPICDELLSSCGFKFNLRRYTMERARIYLDGVLAGETTHVPLQRSDIFGSVSAPSLLYMGGDGSAAASHCFRGRGLHSSTSQLNLSRF